MASGGARPRVVYDPDTMSLERDFSSLQKEKFAQLYERHKREKLTDPQLFTLLGRNIDLLAKFLAYTSIVSKQERAESVRKIEESRKVLETLELEDIKTRELLDYCDQVRTEVTREMTILKDNIAKRNAVSASIEADLARKIRDESHTISISPPK